MVHRDVKSSNVLVQSNGSVKIGDLGLTVEVKDGGDIDELPMVGSKYWMAPEMLHYKYVPTPTFHRPLDTHFDNRHHTRPYGFKADIWSFGATVMEMAEGEPPYIEYAPLRGMHSSNAPACAMCHALIVVFGICLQPCT
jgi:serine/threonine protein kinase